MKYKIPYSELQNVNSTIPAIKELQGEKFKFYGNGGLKQLAKDCGQRNFRLSGFSHLGMRAKVAESQDIDVLADMADNILTKFGTEKKEAIINAHSQEPAYLIFRILFSAFQPPVSEQFTIIDRRDSTGENSDIVSNIVIDGDKTYFDTISHCFWFKSLIDAKMYAIPGPIFARFELHKDGAKSYYQLSYIETDNAELYNILRGNIPSEEMLMRYTQPNVVELTEQCISLSKRVEDATEEAKGLRANSIISKKDNLTVVQERNMSIQSLELNMGLLQRKLELLQASALLSAKKTNTYNDFIESKKEFQLGLKINVAIEKLRAYQAHLQHSMSDNDLKTVAADKFAAKLLFSKTPLSNYEKAACRKHTSCEKLINILRAGQGTNREKLAVFYREYTQNNHREVLEIHRKHYLYTTLKVLLSIATMGIGFLFFKVDGKKATQNIQELFDARNNIDSLQSEAQLHQRMAR